MALVEIILGWDPYTFLGCHFGLRHFESTYFKRVICYTFLWHLKWDVTPWGYILKFSTYYQQTLFGGGRETLNYVKST